MLWALHHPLERQRSPLDVPTGPLLIPWHGMAADRAPQEHSLHSAFPLHSSVSSPPPPFSSCFWLWCYFRSALLSLWLSCFTFCGWGRLTFLFLLSAGGCSFSVLACSFILHVLPSVCSLSFAISFDCLFLLIFFFTLPYSFPFHLSLFFFSSCFAFPVFFICFPSIQWCSLYITVLLFRFPIFHFLLTSLHLQLEPRQAIFLLSLNFNQSAYWPNLCFIACSCSHRHSTCHPASANLTELDW